MSPSAESPQGTGPILEFAGVTKSFHGVRVLDRVSFAVGRGRSIGLVGENGAGKSTLMNILGGSLRPDSGFLRLDGVEYSPQNPLEAQRNGIAFIHQELNLFSNLDIAENISICDFPRYRGLPLIDRRELGRRAAAAVVRVGLDLSPDTLVEDLSAGERQLVEIAKALRQEPRILILDEPTTSLSARESARLFELLRTLRRGGLSMIYISHDLGDVFQLADDLVVLRDGAVVGSGPRGDFDEDRLVSLMVGRSMSRVSPARTGPASEEPALELRGVTQPGVVRDISFRLARGEVLGIAGLMGSGRSELARIIFGVDPHASGEILVKGLPRGRTGPGASIRSGMAFVTEDRREDGLALDAAIDENVALVTLGKAARGPLRILDGGPLRAAVEGIRRRVGLPASADGLRAAKTLSGGNQQKVVLAKWLLAEPSVLILDEPTRGIDVGAKFEIHGLVSDLARRGAGILLISSEIEELLGISDRILVMARGEIRDELRRDDFDRERILRAALGDPSRRGRGEATP